MTTSESVEATSAGTANPFRFDRTPATQHPQRLMPSSAYMHFVWSYQNDVQRHDPAALAENGVLENFSRDQDGHVVADWYRQHGLQLDGPREVIVGARQVVLLLKHMINADDLEHHQGPQTLLNVLVNNIERTHQQLKDLDRTWFTRWWNHHEIARKERQLALQIDDAAALLTGIQQMTPIRIRCSAFFHRPFSSNWLKGFTAVRVIEHARARAALSAVQ